MAKPYNRLPDYVEEARMDGIAVAGDIEVLLDKIYEAIVRRDEVEAARLIGLARKRAGRIKEINREMKRKGEA